MEIKISFLGIVDHENLVKELMDVVAKYGGVCIDVETTPNMKDADQASFFLCLFFDKNFKYKI